jgi:hypothetical protein
MINIDSRNLIKQTLQIKKINKNFPSKTKIGYGKKPSLLKQVYGGLVDQKICKIEFLLKSIKSYSTQFLSFICYKQNRRFLSFSPL